MWWRPFWARSTPTILRKCPEPGPDTIGKASAANAARETRRPLTHSKPTNNAPRPRTTTPKRGPNRSKPWFGAPTARRIEASERFRRPEGPEESTSGAIPEGRPKADRTGQEGCAPSAKETQSGRTTPLKVPVVTTLRATPTYMNTQAQDRRSETWRQPSTTLVRRAHGASNRSFQAQRAGRIDFGSDTRREAVGRPNGPGRLRAQRKRNTER